MSKETTYYRTVKADPDNLPKGEYYGDVRHVIVKGLNQLIYWRGSEWVWYGKGHLIEMSGKYWDDVLILEHIASPESDAVEFGEWMDENCVKNMKGYFLNDLIGGKVENEFTIPELYQLFKSQKQ